MGLGFESLVVCMVFCIRRHHQNCRRDELDEGFIGIQPPRATDNPFSDDHVPQAPVICSVDADAKDVLAPTIVGGSGHGRHNSG